MRRGGAERVTEAGDVIGEQKLKEGGGLAEGRRHVVYGTNTNSFMFTSA